jgi:hypothetical protein
VACPCAAALVHGRGGRRCLLSVEDWIAGMDDKSPTVVIRAYGVLTGILDDAVKGKRLPANPG